MNLYFYKSLGGQFLFFFCTINLHAQYHIDGPISANLGETKNYSVEDNYGYPPYGQDPYYYDWYVDGLITATNNSYYGGYDIPDISVYWNYPGTNYISVDIYDDYFNDYYYYYLEVAVTGTLPDDPGIPTTNNNVCSPVLTRSGTPQNGDTWYWQGKDANGTSTTKGSGATYYPYEGSGMYYIRARSSSGVWSIGSGSVAVTITTAPLWYTDVDNDGFGDPASTPITSCTQPSGRVSNNFDQCPTQAGNPLNNGCPGNGDPGSTDKNYVHTITPLIAVSNVSQITNNSDKTENVSYFDGLGRSIQGVGIRSGGQGQDIKVPLVYDEFGRQARTYLPHATATSSPGTYTSNTSLINDLTAYYVSKHPNQLNGSAPNAYAETRFDTSPLSRTLESGTPGQTWLINPTSDSDRTTKYDYATNALNEVYKIDYPGAGQSLSIANYYTQGTLLKNTVKNENWVTADGKVNTKDVFTDKSGKKIAEYSYILESSTLKTLKTYYVYEDRGNMVYVLTPKIFSIISGTTISVTNINDLAFQYIYDTYNRQIEQKVPGKKQWEYMVYDQLDRPILTQDKNLSNSGKWLFTKYDAYGRAIYSGLFSSTLNRASLQSAVDAYITSNTTNLSNIESRTPSTSSIGGVNINYSNNAYPTTGLEVLTVNYYDDYTYTDGDRPTTPTTVLGQTVTTRTKGMPTGSWTKTLGGSSWSKSYTYYNEKGSPIKIYEKNHLGGYTDNESKLDFRGKIENATTVHKRLSGSPALTIQDRFEYDHAERPMAHYQIVNSNPEECIAKNTYNELGRLIIKDIGGTSGISLQTMDYTYDVRGALKGVNDVENMGNDLFAFGLNYESGEGTNFNAPQYNGNISQMVWKSAHNNTKKSYYYDYDGLNRFKKGRYGEGTSLTTNWQKFEVDVTGYDHNGNITGLTRRGGSSGSTIDNLTYYYDSGNGNQLMKINEAANGSEGFVNGANGGDDYVYDDNGNLTQDLNKTISLIEYNHLDLVTKVTFASGARIEFLYDASGAKLQMKYINGSNTATTDHIGGFQYVDDILQFFPTPEGYVKYTGGTYSYVYSLKDHLGNNRVSFENISGINTIVSSSDYYPMGMTHDGEYLVNSNYNYKYQGKEKLAANGYNMYDFGSRMYDASVGRWFNTDPQNQFGSPYLAMGNNWVVSVDPNGEFVFAAALVGAIIGGITAGVAYTATAIANDDWNFGKFAGSVLGGALVGAVSNGLASPGNAATLSSSSISKAVLRGTLSAVTPSANIPISNNFSLSLSPALAFGSSATGIGANASLNANFGDFSASYGYGASYFGKSTGTGKAGYETRNSWSASYSSGDFSASLYSTNFSSGETSQKVGGIGVGIGDFNARVENDFLPGLTKWSGNRIGDDYDRFRTAAVQIGFKDFKAGFNLFTGDPSLDEGSYNGHDGASINGSYSSNGSYMGSNANKYRLGAAYFGYRGNRLGVNSESIRNSIQNGLHDIIGSPRFPVLNIPNSFYQQYQTNNPFTLW
ncbi:polymorphic toxin type 23 domain-containing protein [Gelidibacter japonicus]|uniref:polymorphic toxin type 23 domain-containing protein n=1 Tax=Gelidibacter japonicus TaxID=1962232 RepID=UPI002AFE603E|nr:polymorphic toxin type 23 domain-containing protein [Gelidibacter japonicus]